MKTVGNKVAFALLTLLFSFVLTSSAFALNTSSVVSFSNSNLLTDNVINSNYPIIYGDSWTASFTNSTDCRIVVADSVRSFIIEPGKSLTFPSKADVLTQSTLNVSSMPHIGSCANEVYRSSVNVYPGTLVSDLNCETNAHNFDIRFTYAGLIPKTSYFYSPSDPKAQYYVGNDKGNGVSDVTIPDTGQDQIYSLYNANQKGDSIKIASTTCHSASSASNNSKNNTLSAKKSNAKLILVLTVGTFITLMIAAIETISLWVIFEKAKLKGVLNLAGRGGFKVVAARVIGRGSASTFSQTITIDAGSSDGVSKDMTVMSDVGLVGVVKAVSSSSAIVLLMSDPTFRIGVRIAGSQSVGVLQGEGSSHYNLQLLDAAGTINHHDVILSLGSDNNHPFVPGIPIGYVSSVDHKNASLTQTATVTGYSDLNGLGVVSVILQAPAGDPKDSLVPKPTPTATIYVTSSAKPDTATVNSTLKPSPLPTSTLKKATK